MPDLNHVIDAHTSQMQGWWRDPEYIRESEIEKYLKGSERDP